MYHLHIKDLTEEDNAQYTCVAINNGGRVISTAELYVHEKENIKRPDMMLKLQNLTGYNLLSNTEDRNDSIYSPKSLNESDKLTESFPFLATNTETTSTASFEAWPRHSETLSNNEKTLIKKNNTLKRRKSEQIQMNAYYQSLPELNVLLPENNIHNIDNVIEKSPELLTIRDLKETKQKITEITTIPCSETSEETEIMVNI